MNDTNQNKEIYIAFDPLALIILSNIHAKRQGNKTYIDYSASEIRDQLGYYRNILDLIYAGDIKPVILETVYQETLDSKNAREFIAQYGYFNHRGNNPIEIKRYEDKRWELANAYCMPFSYKNKEYAGPFQHERREGESKLYPEMKAFVVADASMNFCQLVVADEYQYLHKPDEKVRNERSLGIMQVNYDKHYCRWTDNNSLLSILGFKRETVKPISIRKFGAMVKHGVELFHCMEPNQLSRKNTYENDDISIK